MRGIVASIVIFLTTAISFAAEPSIPQQNQAPVPPKPCVSPNPAPHYPKDAGWERFEIQISLEDQTTILICDGVEINRSSTSTGRAGHSTPKGEFTIVEKNRTHRSTIYHASMPFQMRLNEWAISLHAGYVPGGKRRASHGCIRLPLEKAKEFFDVVPRGTKVIIK